MPGGLPWVLTAIRLALALAVVGLAASAVPRPWFVLPLASALWLDIADGVLARRFGVDSPAFRRFDSLCDVVFFLAVLACIGWVEPDIFRQYSWAFAALVCCECVCQALSVARFGCTTSTHSWCCKAWALLLFFASARVLVKGEAGWPLHLALAAGAVAYADVWLILLMSRRVPVDVPTSWHAWQIARSAAASSSKADRVS
ncbi:MAG: CDP-alcohol phosphatidyltransferase family protein [Pirellulaceae bacterium]|nr:CDP-alcohol phosphatidyltransferase family protein [Pirellulaceae bacterium]